jgi:hypothetical protein
MRVGGQIFANENYRFISDPSSMHSESPRLRRRVLNKTRDVHFALVLSGLRKIIRALYSQPHVRATANITGLSSHIAQRTRCETRFLLTCFC